MVALYCGVILGPESVGDIKILINLEIFMNKNILNKDKEFGSLINSLSPASMHRLINLLRKELKIELKKNNYVEVKS